jgi:diamine N-acetyltransferase
LIEYVRTRPGAKELRVSCGEGEGSPEGFYQSLGFERTGEMEENEVVLRLAL